MREIFRRLFRRASLDAQVGEEIESHIAMRAEHNRKSGMPPDEALRAARRQFGNPASVRETLYAFNGFALLDSVLQDFIFAVRGVRRNLALSLTVVVTIAIGVGAVASMFSIMRNLLLAPPPHVHEPDRVFGLHQQFPVEGSEELGAPLARTNYPFYELLANRAQSLDSVAGYTDANLAVGTGADAGMTHAAMVSAGFWRTLAVQPVLGRFIEDAEAHPATGARVVVLGQAFWNRHFSGEKGAVGQTIRIKGQPYAIIGIAPRGFRGVELADIDLWLPLFARDDGSGRVTHTSRTSSNLKVVVRLKPAVTTEQASAELTGLQRVFMEEDPSRLQRYRRARALLGPITGGLGDDLRPMPEARVTVWLVGVAFVLVAIACLNVAGLLLLRAMRRRREIAVRLALGISRGRLTRQLLTESSLLALLGGLAAVAAVALGGTWLQRTILPAMAWEPAALIDSSVLAVTALATLAALAAAGMAPLWYARAHVLPALHERSRNGQRKRPRMQRALLTVQGALSVLLLVGAGLFLRSLHNLKTLDIGLDRDQVLAVSVDFAGSGRSAVDVAAFFQRTLERVSAIPGVTQASLALSIPLRSASGGSVRIPGRDGMLTTSAGAVPFVNQVTPGFFETTGMHIVQGRGFAKTESSSSPVIVVNETMARLGWPERSPVGECVFEIGKEKMCATIIGVVADARRFSIIDESPHPYFYTPLDMAESGPRSLLIRMAPGASRMDSAIRQAMQELDSGVPYIRIETLGEALDPQIRPWRLGASMFTAFGILAMSLAVIGLWSSVSYAVSQRQHEFAVRLAIGARRGTLLRLVLAEGLRTTLAAVTTGILLAAGASRFMAHLLYRVSPHDPLVFGVIAVGVLAVATVASLLPVWQVFRIQPADALRAE